MKMMNFHSGINRIHCDGTICDGGNKYRFLNILKLLSAFFFIKINLWIKGFDNNLYDLFKIEPINFECTNKTLTYRIPAIAGIMSKIYLLEKWILVVVCLLTNYESQLR